MAVVLPVALVFALAEAVAEAVVVALLVAVPVAVADAVLVAVVLSLGLALLLAGVALVLLAGLVAVAAGVALGLAVVPASFEGDGVDSANMWSQSRLAGLLEMPLGLRPPADEDSGLPVPVTPWVRAAAGGRRWLG